MARKIIPALAMMFMAFICLASYIIISPSAPANRVLQFSPADSTALQASLPFRAPQNVTFTLVDGEIDTLRIVWDEVAGATGYNVYSAESVPDTTVMVPSTMYYPALDIYEYRYSYHPRFGDVYGHIELNEEFKRPLRMYESIIHTPWQKVNESPITQPKLDISTAIEQRTSMLYYVTAVR